MYLYTLGFLYFSITPRSFMRLLSLKKKTKTPLPVSKFKAKTKNLCKNHNGAHRKPGRSTWLPFVTRNKLSLLLRSLAVAQKRNTE